MPAISVQHQLVGILARRWSKENVQLFRRGLAAWNERDFGAIVEMCHPDVEWTFSDRLPDTTGTSGAGMR
jgi:ketosteroid isomerase-like protein